MLAVLFLMTRILGGEGIWWTAPVSEFICLIYAISLYLHGKKKGLGYTNIN